jgi:serine phosphatase RsbU (regulator of sigma subunit)
MGHGLPAARRATFVRTALATFARFTDDPARLLELANQSLIEKVGTTSEFVTAVCAVFDPDTGSVSWASAGHPVPRALDTGKRIGDDADVGVTAATVAHGGGLLADDFCLLAVRATDA